MWFIASARSAARFTLPASNTRTAKTTQSAATPRSTYAIKRVGTPRPGGGTATETEWPASTVAGCCGSGEGMLTLSAVAAGRTARRCSRCPAPGPAITRHVEAGVELRELLEHDGARLPTCTG